VEAAVPTIHPTAVVDPAAELAEDVAVGPGCVIEADVAVGGGTVLRDHVVLRRHTTLGRNNLVDAFCVLGGEPQDVKFDPASRTFLRIGDDNVFREHVTISRATGAGCETRVGNGTYWMAGAHAGHNAVVEDGATLVNNSALAGHVTLGRQAIISANVVVHQYCWIGEMVMTQGLSAASTHVPPFCLVATINGIIGLNHVGLRRAAQITAEDHRQLKEAFRLLYRSKQPPAKALEQMDACTNWGRPAGRFRDFVRRVLAAEPPFDRGLCPHRRHR
jgi:UDP-N-acetylglucosamine acyltransferase